MSAEMNPLGPHCQPAPAGFILVCVSPSTGEKCVLHIPRASWQAAVNCGDKSFILVSLCHRGGGFVERKSRISCRN